MSLCVAHSTARSAVHFIKCSFCPLKTYQITVFFYDENNEYAQTTIVFREHFDQPKRCNFNLFWSHRSSICVVYRRSRCLVFNLVTVSGSFRDFLRGAGLNCKSTESGPTLTLPLRLYNCLFAHSLHCVALIQSFNIIPGIIMLCKYCVLVVLRPTLGHRVLWFLPAANLETIRYCAVQLSSGNKRGSRPYCQSRSQRIHTYTSGWRYIQRMHVDVVITLDKCDALVLFLEWFRRSWRGNWDSRDPQSCSGNKLGSRPYCQSSRGHVGTCMHVRLAICSANACRHSNFFR